MLDEEGAFDRALVAAAAAVVDAGAGADGPCWLGVEAAMVLYFAYQWGWGVGLGVGSGVWASVDRYNYNNA